VKKLIASLLLALPINAFANLVEVQLDIRPNPNYYNPNGELVYLVIRSVADEKITVKKVTVNRGNSCRVNRWDGYAQLKFGAALRGVMYGCSSRDIKEVVVKTDRGTETYNF
jgi:hypothetical protein